MDNQKSNEGMGSNLGKDSTQKGAGGTQPGSGSPNVSGSGNMGSSGAGSANKQTPSTGGTQASSGGTVSSSSSPANSTSGNKGAASGGNQASAAQSSSSASSNSGSMGGASAGSMGKDMPKNADDMHNAIDKAAGSAQPVVERLASGAHAGVDKISGMFSGASGSMDERKRQVTDAYNNFATTGREYVRKSPGTAVLGALAAGYVLSKIFGSRRH